MFKLLTSKQGCTVAFRTLKKTLKVGTQVYKNHMLGWPGGSGRFDVHWNRRLRFWWHLGVGETLNRYWCTFGLDDPGSKQSLSLTVEINPPHEGINGRVAGAFVQGPDGHIYLAHSGKIGGGRKGIGKAEFLNFCRGANWQEVIAPKGKNRPMIILGRIDGSQLQTEVADFTREVARFKQAVSDGDDLVPSPQTWPAFSPEFSGKRNPYPLGGEVEAECLHGTIVNTLAERLSDRGLKVGSDKPRDLFIVSNDAISTLFEVKTNLSTTSIYGGVGQLFLHAALERITPRQILVLPGPPGDGLSDAVKKLGILVLQYRWKSNKAHFIDLDKLLSGA